MSLWAFRFVLFYIAVMLVQPQNRFPVLWPWRIALVCMIIAAVLHMISASQEGKPLIRFGPATITALILLAFSFIANYMGTYNGAWNSEIDIIVKNCIALIMIEAMATTVERVWAIQATVLLSTLWWIKGGLRLSGAGATFSGDRIMGPAVSLVENPNGYAYMMCLMIPLYLYFYQKSTHKYIRLGFLFCALASVYIILNTGSRTGMLILIVLGMVLVPRYFAQYKASMIAGGLAIFVILGTVSPKNMERFKTIGDSVSEFLAGGYEEKDPTEMTQDEQSAWERKMKNKHSWALIKDHPVLGLGLMPDQGYIGERYQYATGQVHNEWLYIGVRMGIIGMALYFAFMTFIFRFGNRVQQETKVSFPAMSDLGWTLKMQGVVFLVGGSFSPVGWNPLYMFFAACASALWLNYQNQSWNRATESI